MNKGFTLIELMIVVAIVAIIAAVALPSYQTFVQDGRRAECRAFALDIASRQERYWTQNSTYSDDATFVADLGLTNGILSENDFCQAQMTESGDNFLITITMIPADTECAPLTLRNTGVRGPNAECWR